MEHGKKEVLRPSHTSTYSSQPAFQIKADETIVPATVCVCVTLCANVLVQRDRSYRTHQTNCSTWMQRQFNISNWPLPQCKKPNILRGLFWDSGSGFHNPLSSPLPHPAKSSPFSSFKCPLISLTATPCMAVIWFVPIFHLHHVHIKRLVCQKVASSLSSCYISQTEVIKILNWSWCYRWKIRANSLWRYFIKKHKCQPHGGSWG